MSSPWGKVHEMKLRWSCAAARSGAVAVAFLAAMGCGGSGGGASCPDTFAACGGDVLGSWNLTSSCYTLTNPLADDCPESTLESQPTASGSVVFRSDGTYSSSLTFGGRILFRAPASCLDGQTCTDLSDPADDRTCTGTDQCSCTTELEDNVSEDQGTYATSGTSAMLSPTLELPQTVEYCVDGDTMTVRLPSTDPEILLVFTR